MAKRDAFLIRIDPKLLESLRKWSEDDLRSLNAQIEYLLTQSLRSAGRLPTAKKSPSPPKKKTRDEEQ